MVALYENGILYKCDECYRYLDKKIENNEPFYNIPSEYKHELLICIVTMLTKNHGDIYSKPKETRKLITEYILQNSSFDENEIDDVFKQFSRKTCHVFTPEFLQDHPEVNTDIQLQKNIIFGKAPDKYYETVYYFPVNTCAWINEMNLCPMTLIVERCIDCGQSVINWPENTLSLSHDLVCHRCYHSGDPYYCKKGIVKKGRPDHHGQWDCGPPEFVFSGTDYFAILHPHCQNASETDGMGFMDVSGLYVDDCGRIVLSLECRFCGAKNAIKPFVKRGNIPLLTIEGSTWQRIGNSIDDILWLGEGDRIEFKSTLRFDIIKNCYNNDLIVEVLKTIVAFLNTDGGTLLIGVDDEGNAIGLQFDYSTMNKQNKDGFQKLLRDLISDKIGKEYHQYIDISFWKKDNEEICRVDVKKADEDAFLNNIYYKRAGNVTIKVNRDGLHN